MISVRCSALPRIMKCGRSADREGLLVDEWHESSSLGTAVHDVLRPVVEGLASVPTEEAIEDAALRWDVDKKELSVLAWSGYKIWQEIGPSFGDGPTTEVEYLTPGRYLPGFGELVEITGHVDVEAIVPGAIAPAFELRQLDWKSGRVDKSYGAQVRGYMVQGLLKHPECQSATHIVAWLREQEAEPYRMTRDQVDDFLADLGAALAREEHVVGNHCSFCPRRATCGARRMMAKNDVAIFAQATSPDAMLIDPLEIAELAPAAVGQLWDMWKRVKRYGDRIESGVRSLVEERGEVDLGDRVLFLKESTKREIDTAAAWKEIESRVDDMAEVATIGIGAMEEAVKAKAGKGKGAAAIRELNAALEAAGAVKTKTTKTLTERRK